MVQCPKCKESAIPSGVLSVNALDITVYHCESCKVNRKVMGETFEVRLTFAMDRFGNPIDPATGEAIDL